MKNDDITLEEIEVDGQIYIHNTNITEEQKKSYEQYCNDIAEIERNHFLKLIKLNKDERNSKTNSKQW